MFASNTVEILKYQKNNNQRDENTSVKNDVFTQILYIHKKLKNIAQNESLAKTRFKVAKLNSKELNEVKQLETSLGYYFIAYESDKEIEENKKMLLNKINLLLDEYSNYLKQTKAGKDDEFKEFFEQ